MRNLKAKNSALPLTCEPDPCNGRAVQEALDIMKRSYDKIGGGTPHLWPKWGEETKERINRVTGDI